MCPCKSFVPQGPKCLHIENSRTLVVIFTHLSNTLFNLFLIFRGIPFPKVYCLEPLLTLTGSELNFRKPSPLPLQLYIPFAWRQATIRSNSLNYNLIAPHPSCGTMNWNDQNPYTQHHTLTTNFFSSLHLSRPHHQPT